MLGTLVSMSVVQGGPGFPVLLPAVYEYITTGQYRPQDIWDTDVPDSQVQSLLAQVCFNQRLPFESVPSTIIVHNLMFLVPIDQAI